MKFLTPCSWFWMGVSGGTYPDSFLMGSPPHRLPPFVPGMKDSQQNGAEVGTGSCGLCLPPAPRRGCSSQPQEVPPSVVHGLLFPMRPPSVFESFPFSPPGRPRSLLGPDVLLLDRVIFPRPCIRWNSRDAWCSRAAAGAGRVTACVAPELHFHA